jgi:RNA-directed DNA polymerase
VLEPIFEREFAAHSYGFRPGRGCKDALRQVDHLLKQGYVYVVDADLKSYFDTIPHGPLMDRVRERIADRRVLTLIESFLKAGIMDGLKEWSPEAGAPQGAVLSPLLSNIYLNPLDHLMAAQGFEMVRYADDFVILCRSPEDAQRALETVSQWTATAELTLHPTKTRIVNAASEGFDFLGYHFVGSKRWPREKSRKKLKDTLRAKTRRKRGDRLATIVADVNQTLVGWFGYFKHSNKWTFPVLDSWIRMRLRSILRRRPGGKGRGKGWDHNRWTNAFFTEQGLFSLTTAHASELNPLAGKTINRRAGCGKSASPVRREGGPNPIGSSYPIIKLISCLSSFSWFPPLAVRQEWNHERHERHENDQAKKLSTDFADFHR